MANPVYSGRLMSSNPIENIFFHENRHKIDKFNSQLPEIIEKCNRNLEQSIESARESLEQSDISFNAETEHLKRNILAMVSLIIYKMNK